MPQPAPLTFHRFLGIIFMALHRYLAIPALLATAACVMPTGAALAQQVPPSPPSMAATPMPGTADIYRMVWTTMATVHGGIVSGNYSVLRDISAPGFQAANDPAKLAAIFDRLRAGGTDLSQTLLVTPAFRAPPRLIQPGLLQVQGSFALRPAAIDFEMLYQWTGGQWRMFGVAISTRRVSTDPGPAPAAPPPARR
jgi:hypothetical protein